MKFFTFVFAMLLAGASFASNTETKALEAQIERLTKAMVSADKKELEAVAHPQLSYGHSSGRVENQAEFVDQIVSGRSDFVKIELEDQQITLSGDTAMVRHILVADTADGGVANSIRIGILLVWQKESGEWKLLGRQAFKLS